MSDREAAPSGTPLLTASGCVVARRKAVVSAKIQGRLADLRVEEGARVGQGEVIARLEGQGYACRRSAHRRRCSSPRRRLGAGAPRFDAPRRILTKRGGSSTSTLCLL